MDQRQRQALTVAPYGSWPSPITADVLVQEVVSLSAVTVDGDDVWWSEGRPSESGRVVVVCDGNDVVPPPYSARTRVHEYGGGAFAVHDGTLVFSNDMDQRLWRIDPGGDPRPLTPAGSGRFADGVVTPDGAWFVCVREREDINDIVALPTTGIGEDAEPLVLASGHDFYAAPRVSPDGRRLAWLCWDHPNMPWDGTELWTGDFSPDGLVSDERRVAGGPEESISQPRWSPDGGLHWISDRTGWWNLYSDAGPLAPTEAEFAGPDWIFGQSTYTFLADGRLVATWFLQGFSYLGVVADGRVEPVDVPFTAMSSLRALGQEVVAIAASAHEPPAVVAIDPDTGRHRVIRSSRATPVPAEAVSEARPISFPSEGGRTAHAFFYPPRLEGWEGPPGERPPLIVRSHGGPTSATSPALYLEIQYWTSRGIGVVDVNYGGSTGYGRAYRRLLDGKWGIVDVEDCVAAARYLAETGAADPVRTVARGGSAGGYTTLAALTFCDAFAAGASYYGVSDLETLARDTHKFESRYLDRLIGPYPEARAVYHERSPIHFADRITVPVILLQGLEDKVVPPSQAEVLVEALRANRVPFAYLTFEGEQHGFRKAETITRAIEAELWFYGQVLGFEPAELSWRSGHAGRTQPVTIENADRL